MSSEESPVSPAPKQRRQSIDFPPHFSLKTQLQLSLSEFLQLYDENRDRMIQIHNEVQKVPAELNKIGKKRLVGQIAAVATTAVGAVFAAAAAPLTGGLSLGLLGAAVAAAVAGTGTYIGSLTVQNHAKEETENRLKSLRVEFKRLVQPLKDQLKTIRDTSKRLRQKEPGDTDLQELELGARVKTSIRVKPKKRDSELMEQFEETVLELDKLRLLLETHRDRLESH